MSAAGIPPGRAPSVAPSRHPARRTERGCCKISRTRLALHALAVLNLVAIVSPIAAAPHPSTTDEAEWPHWRGTNWDGGVHSADPFAEPFRLEVRWKRRIGSGYSAIAVAEGHAVTMASDGERDVLVALAADTGEERWRLDLGPTYPGREGSNDGPTSTPAIDGAEVYALGPRGDLVAVSVRDGRLLWHRQIVRELGAVVPHWGFATSPLVDGERVVVLTGGAPERAVTAFDRRDGHVLWRSGSDEVSYQSPMLLHLHGEEILIAAGDRYLFALDPASGRELWRYEHGGEAFYRRILNPVVVGQDSLLLTLRPDQAVLVRFEPRREELWTTPAFKRSYAPPVAHDGYVYGYSGSFLTCIDGRTGELAWKSRPPGDGFPIVVGKHLVVQTKQGSLHVAEASPRGYREVAAIDLFDRLSWTPPSFAEGRIYARDSYDEIACVDVVHTAVPEIVVAKPSEPRRGILPDSDFGRWVAEVEEAPDRAERVRSFLDAHPRFPVVEGERIVHFVYTGEVEDIALRGEMLETGEQLALHRLGDTDLYYASFGLEPDTRMVYQFVRDLEDPIPDPRNPNRAESLLYSGRISLLYMPASERVTVPDQPIRGSLLDVPFTTARVRVGGKTWGGERRVRVYLPPGYESAAAQRFPTVYVLYGEQMLDTAHLDALLDREVGSTLDPFVAVFVDSISPYEYARSQRRVHGRMLAEELVPLIDARFRTLADARHRAVLGVDEGAYAALEIALRFPETFGAAAAHSVLSIGKGGQELRELIAHTPLHPLRLYIDWGRYDQLRAADLVDVRADCRDLSRRLGEHGYPIAGREWNDGSDLVFWGMRALEALRGFFPLGGGELTAPPMNTATSRP